MAFSFKDIIAWQKAYEFVLLVYKEEFNTLTYSIEGTSYYLNTYCKAISEDRGIKD
jgi:hypothetical protein